MVKKVKAAREKKPTDKLADKTALTKFLQGVFGDAQKKILKRMWRKAQEIGKLEPKYEKMSDEEIAAYVESKEPMDKAGAYAVQGIGALFVSGIEGDYSTVVGLSLPLLREMLLQLAN